MRRASLLRSTAGLVAACVLAAVAAAEPPEDDVRLEPMWRLVEALARLDRTSSGPGEREAARLLARTLDEHGIAYRLDDIVVYLSLPVDASLEVLGPEPFAPRAITPSFSATTDAEGVTGELVYVGPDDPSVVTSRPEDFEGVATRGRIVLLRGYPSPGLVRLAREAGAAAAVCIAPSPRLVNMIVSPVWGSPTPEDLPLYPSLPVVTVTAPDGARLEEAARRGPVRVRLRSRTDTGWKTVPLLVAEVRGSVEPEKFVLVANHLDSWHEGVTDSATGNAALAELARVFQKNRGRLRRSVRIAWWPAHSTGRYAGSTWYADRYFEDLRANAVAYMAIDSPGVRSATEIEPEGMAEATGLLEAVLRARAGVDRPATRSFRYNDESFWGIGVPSLTFYPAIPLGHPDRARDAGGSAYGYWWHTTEDTLDKADAALLVRDTKLYLDVLWPLATEPVLPFDFTRVAAQMRARIDELAAAAGGLWDFAPTRRRIEAFGEAARRLRERAPARAAPGEAIARYNAVVLRLSRIVDPVLYTRRGPFRHDPALSMPLFPGLAAAERGGAEPELLRTELARETNRIDEALDEAIRTARSF